MNYIESIQSLNKEIIACKNLKFLDLTALPAGDAEIKYLDANRDLLHNDIFDFYRQVKTYSLKWESKIKLPEKIYGQAKFLDSATALSDWKDVVYFEDGSPMQHFKIFDQFTNEACCGFYTKPSTNASHGLIYYYDFSDEPVSLQLTISEYISMMIEAKGFLYWQRVLRDHLFNHSSPHSTLMQTALNKVFPNFSYEAFISKFDELKNN